VTAERYTAVFTGLLSLKKPGEHTYLRMSDDPLGSGHHTLTRGRPPYGELGPGTSFSDLPEACKSLILDTYSAMRSSDFRQKTTAATATYTAAKTISSATA
jgi:hypothetical protein